MPDILLATLNSRYIHSSLGLRYLYANLASLKKRCAIFEADINRDISQLITHILSQDPQILGLGVYVWNVEKSTLLVHELKQRAPRIKIILGGPEVSYESLSQQIVTEADYTICGEGEIEFASLCRQLLQGSPPREKLISAEPPELSALELPYEAYSDEDVAHRVIYVESSRGCPFRCEFCLSSIEHRVRNFDIKAVLKALQVLISRGARHFKFIDRTFNLDTERAARVLDFFLQQENVFCHFELLPKTLPEALKSRLRQFKPGRIQLEVGVQSFDSEVCARIGRKQRLVSVCETLRFLREETAVHIHADLIAGLPGENLASLAQGFNLLYSLGPQEIQLGILKRLRGAPIARHDVEWKMRYNPSPPYQLLENSLLSVSDLQRLQRFAKYWELFSNSARFKQSLAFLLPNSFSAFEDFLLFSDWCYSRTKRTYGLSLLSLCELLFDYLTEHLKQDKGTVAQAIFSDYAAPGRYSFPSRISAYLKRTIVTPQSTPPKKAAPLRQARHL